MKGVSYVAQIQHDADAAPALPTMRLLDPRTFQFTGAANYLNHPPLYYALLAHLGRSWRAIRMRCWRIA